MKKKGLHHHKASNVWTRTCTYRIFSIAQHKKPILEKESITTEHFKMAIYTRFREFGESLKFILYVHGHI